MKPKAQPDKPAPPRLTHRQAQGMLNRAGTVYVEVPTSQPTTESNFEWIRAKKYSAKNALRRLHAAGVKNFAPHVWTSALPESNMVVLIPNGDA